MIAATLPAAVGKAAGNTELSKANELLFEKAHLDGLESPAALHYQFQSTGPEDGEAFRDEIVVHLRPNPGGQDWSAEFEYLGGARERPVPPVGAATGNPIIKVFLQREVLEMEERTGGNWRYFQKAIKTALQSSAEVVDTEFDYRGRPVEGRRIRIEPYRDDPRRGQMGVYARMRYTIVLSGAVPGEIYQMTATAEPTEGGDEPAFAESLELVRTEPAAE